MTNPSENIQEGQQPNSQEEHKPLFGGTDSQGKERLFNSVEEAQQSWQHSQDFIKDKVNENKSLETKVQELEAKLNQSMKLEEALEKLQNNQEATPMTNEPSQQQTTEQTSQLDMAQLTEQITKQVMGQLSNSQQEQVMDKNQNDSISAAQAVYGEAFEAKLREKASTLGMSDSDIITMSRSNPTLFKATFGLDKTTSQSVAPPSGGNTPQNNAAPVVDNKPAFFAKDATSQMVERLNAKAKEMGLNAKF